MTALAEALLSAQRQAIGAVGKAYVAGALDGSENVSSLLDAIGCSDAVDRAQLLAAWDVLREYGAPAPQPAQAIPPRPENEPASPSQMKYLADLADKAGAVAPDYQLTKANASKVIEQLKAGTYNPDEWTVPF